MYICRMYPQSDPIIVYKFKWKVSPVKRVDWFLKIRGQKSILTGSLISDVSVHGTKYQQYCSFTVSFISPLQSPVYITGNPITWHEFELWSDLFKQKHAHYDMLVPVNIHHYVMGILRGGDIWSARREH